MTARSDRYPRHAGRLADFLETLSLVLVTGALTGVGFIVAAVLLTWATAAFAGESAEAAPAGVLTLRTADGKSVASAPRLATEVRMRITGMVARVRVVQRFENPYDDWYEGVYVFPLPDNAAVDTLQMRVGDRLVQGVIKERQAAKRSYEQAKARGSRAALLEQERPNIFTTSVANIGPRETVSVEIEYQQAVRYADGRFSLRFPLVVAPRYIPGLPLDASPGGSGWARDTTQVPDAARITPPVLHPRKLPDDGVLNPVDIAIELDAGIPLADVASSSHDLRVERRSERAFRITPARAHIAADRDFTLDWIPKQGAAPYAAFFRERHGDADYGLLMIMPPGGDATRTRLPREVVFVIDTSGSMAGASIEQAREALMLALRRLTPTDRFNVIEFNSVTRAFAAEALPATPARIRRALAWVAALQAQGGTEMAEALRTALTASRDPHLLRQVIFLTDAGVGNETELYALIRERLGDSRLFTVGIGSAPNGYFMRKAAEVGRGTYTYIGRTDEVARKMGELYAKLESPAMKNLRVQWPSGVAVETYPTRLPDLYHGEPLLLTVRAPELSGPLRVEGEQGALRWSQTLPLRHGVPNAGIARLWARAKIDALMDGVHEGRSLEAVKRDVIDVALDHDLVSRYTSLVAVEQMPVRPADAALKPGVVPNQLPEGWVHEAVFGPLPQTATPAAVHRLAGAIALLLAALLYFLSWRRAHAYP
ncbi:MAG TPA: marine proteobacterial sortase target protein [Burkholderiales bacterium]|nr:marine proteobacterial sortase target protein [Burkholderiales bacterium]